MPESSICGLAGEVRVGPSPVTSGSDPRSELRPAPDRQRDDSGKESTNPKPNNSPNPKGACGSRSGSQRGGTNLKAEGPIIGLPARIRHVSSCSVSRPRPPPPATASRIFPKKKEKSVPESDPTSPKVSCSGKVLSDRERVQKKKNDPNPKPAWWAHFTAFFLVCVGGGRRRELVDDDVAEAESVELSRGKKSIASKATVAAAAAAAAGPTEEPAAPGLGGMKRFASGRRSDAWASEGEFEIDRDLVLARRSVGSIQEVLRN